MSKRTGVGLIGAAAERVQNEDSLFYEALKKLVNASEEEIRKYLKTKDSHTPQSIIRRIETGEKILKVRPLDGSRLLYMSDRLRYGRTRETLSENYVSTPETELRIDEIIFDGLVRKVFNSLPGVWAQKWLSQNQVVEIADTLSYYFPPADKSLLVLCKKNEKLPVDNDNPGDNLLMLELMPRRSGQINVYDIPWEVRPRFFTANVEARIISPL